MSARSRTRNPHVPPADADDQPAARAEQRKQAAREDRFLQGVYEDGVKEGRTQARTSRSSSKRSSSKLPGAKSTGRLVTQPARRAARATTAPIGGAVYTGVRIIGTALLLIALYLVLTSAGKFAGFVKGPAHAIEWLTSPTKSIPYKES